METQESRAIHPRGHDALVGEPKLELRFADDGARGGGCCAWLLVLHGDRVQSWGGWVDLNRSEFQLN